MSSKHDGNGCNCDSCNGDDKNYDECDVTLAFIKEHSSGACPDCHSTNLIRQQLAPAHPFVDVPIRTVCKDCNYEWTTE